MAAGRQPLAGWHELPARKREIGSDLGSLSGGSNYSAEISPAPLAVATSLPGTNGHASLAGQKPDGWFVAMNEETAFAKSWDITAFAVCARLAS